MVDVSMRKPAYRARSCGIRTEETNDSLVASADFADRNVGMDESAASHREVSRPGGWVYYWDFRASGFGETWNCDRCSDPRRLCSPTEDHHCSTAGFLKWIRTGRISASSSPPATT